MNITFFIGNGFDLNLGLKTKYEHFYKYFIENSDKENIIKSWIDGNEKLWSDLEEKIGQELIKIDSSNLEKFYKDKREMDILLIDYLSKEQEKYIFDEKNIIKEIVKKEMRRSMLDFSNDFSRDDKHSIASTLSIYRNEDYIYSFISFNYTDCLDNIVTVSKGENPAIGSHQGEGMSRIKVLGSVLHIHGTTNEEMILGVNDEDQIANELLKNDEDFLDTFIKMRMNENIGQQKTKIAKEIIADSHVICVFGMSIGNTDKMWWQELINWLFINKHNKLIIFWKGFEDVFERKLPGDTIRLSKLKKKEIFAKGCGKHTLEEYNLIESNIIFSYNANIFNFSKIDTISDKD